MADRRFRNEAVKAAEGLGYGTEIIAEIRKAKTEEEVSQIMCTARQRSMLRQERNRRKQTRTDFLAWAFA